MRLTKSRIVFLGVVGAILALILVYKPGRVLVPKAFGMICSAQGICIDDPSALHRAQKLRDDAILFVETKLGPLENTPRLLFCTTNDCYQKFGNPLTAGQNLGTFGAVINARGWEDYIIRHEIIHHLQNERFGFYQASYKLPRWFIEGMAYSISEDPRRPLPRADIEEYRRKFDAWIADGNEWTSPPD